MLKWLLAAAFLAAVLAANGCGVPGGPAEDDMTPDPSKWVRMESGTNEQLRDVWGADPNDVFAVGGDPDTNGVILHYDGIRWAHMPHPAAGELSGVWGSGPHDVFAVGDDKVLHYDGSEWILVPNVPGNMFKDVWGSGPNDVYVVGYGGIIAHYDGNAWTKAYQNRDEHFYSVWCASANNVVAVGAGDPYYTKHCVFLHYNGTAWRRLDRSDSGYDLRGVWGVSSNDIYAVGGTDLLVGPDGGVEMPGVLRKYDGTRLSEMESIGTEALHAVWGSGPDDIYAVGNMLLHFDGATWSTMVAPRHSFDFDGIWGSGPNDVFLVGSGGHIAHCSGN